MNYCPKCGTKLNAEDKFCSGCGATIKDGVVEEREQTEEFYNPKSTQQQVVYTTSHPLAKMGFVFSLISFGLIILFLLLCVARVAASSSVNTIDAIAIISLMVGIVLGLVSLGLAIPGFIISTKRKYPKKIAIAGLVLSIIVCAFIVGSYFWYAFSISN